RLASWGWREATSFWPPASRGAGPPGGAASSGRREREALDHHLDFPSVRGRLAVPQPEVDVDRHRLPGDVASRARGPERPAPDLDDVASARHHATEQDGVR